MKSMLRDVIDGEVSYQCLAFICPGCAEEWGIGLHMLPVNTDVRTPAWKFDGNLEMPTLSPSILTRMGTKLERVCHSYLIEGVFAFLDDSTHIHAGKSVRMPDLPSWFVKETTK